MITELDPAGDVAIAEKVNDFREDHGIKNIKAYKVALTVDQVEQFQLAPSMIAKPKSPSYKKYVTRHGEKVLMEKEGGVLTPRT